MKQKKKLYKSVKDSNGFGLEVVCNYYEADDWHIDAVILYKEDKKIADLYELLDQLGWVENMFNIDLALEAAEQAADMADFSASE